MSMGDIVQSGTVVLGEKIQGGKMSYTWGWKEVVLGCGVQGERYCLAYREVVIWPIR